MENAVTAFLEHMQTQHRSMCDQKSEELSKIICIAKDAFTTLAAAIATYLLASTCVFAQAGQGTHRDHGVVEAPHLTSPIKETPNIILIILDDVGFGATSTFGGPAETPHLDQLAARGLRYNGFNVTSLCSPTRAALLSGRRAHRVGFGTVVDLANELPGYNGMWRTDAVSVAEILRRNGYSTAAFGKWHNTRYEEISPIGPFDRWPTGLGFEYFYGFMGGEDSQWESTLYRNTTPIESEESSSEPRHLTTLLTDEAIRWMRAHESLAPDKPYFLYFAAGAVHVPHHAPRDWIDRYRGRFDAGWDALRRETFLRQKKLKVIPASAELPPRPAEIPEWGSFSSDEQWLLARQMEVAAGFLAHTDHEIGRLIEAAQESARRENTLILYLVSDNGAIGEGPLGSEGAGTAQVSLKERLPRVDLLGTNRFMNNGYASGWAWAAGTPFRGSKGTAYFGGTRVPLVISWPARINNAGGIRTQFIDGTDIAATIYEVTGLHFPSTVDGVEQQDLDGVSFAYTFNDPAAPSRRSEQIFESLGSRAIYEDGWVAVAGSARDLSASQWELYNVKRDFTQARNVAGRYPSVLKRLQGNFDAEARRSNVYPLQSFREQFANIQAQGPSPVDRSEFVYSPGLPRTYAYRFGYPRVPDFLASHRITAEVDLSSPTDEGVIMAVGSRYAGFTLYIKESHLIYENHFPGREYERIVSRVPLPLGKTVLAFEFTADAEKTVNIGYGSAELRAAPGVGRLYIDEQLVAEGRQAPVISWVWGYGAQGGALGVGEAWSEVSPAFHSPFKFSGILKRVTVRQL